MDISKTDVALGVALQNPTETSQNSKRYTIQCKNRFTKSKALINFNLILLKKKLVHLTIYPMNVEPIFTYIILS